MSKVVVTIVLAIMFKVSLAQQEPNFSHYMYNQIDFNPGCAGWKEMVSVSALGRQQWLGFPGKPTISVFSANMPVNPLGINSGIGLVFQNDNVGYNKDIDAKFAYAYRLKLQNDDKIGIGFSGGFRNRVFKPQWVTSDGSTNDVSLPQNDDSGTAFDMGLGVFYYSEDLYLGLSAVNLLGSQIKYKAAESRNIRHYYVTAGYNYPLKNNSFELQPSLLLMTDAVITEVDLNTVLMYNKRFWGGVSYRINSSFVGMLGIELLSGLRVGYSYDIATTNLSKYNSGTHELMIGYNFSLVKEKIPHKNKSVRFL